MGFIIFIGAFVSLVSLVLLCQKNKICQFGFHDYEKVKSLDCNNYLKKVMEGHWQVFHQGNFETWYRVIFEKIFGDIKYELHDKYVHDKICIKCHKCHMGIEFEKIHIEETVNKYVEDIKQKEIRKKMAKDLFKENCEKGV